MEKTTAPIATHIQNISMCSSNTSLLISVIPLVIFSANQSAVNKGALRVSRSAKNAFLCKIEKSLNNIIRPKISVS